MRKFEILRTEVFVEGEREGSGAETKNEEKHAESREAAKKREKRGKKRED